VVINAKSLFNRLAEEASVGREHRAAQDIRAPSVAWLNHHHQPRPAATDTSGRPVQIGAGKAAEWVPTASNMVWNTNSSGEALTLPDGRRARQRYARFSLTRKQFVPL
jgi:hypothetical protein